MRTEPPPILSELIKTAFRFCVDGNVLASDKLFNWNDVNQIQVQADQGEEIQSSLGIGQFWYARLQAERVLVTSLILARFSRSLDLDAVNLRACIDQAIVKGVIAERNGNIEALA